MTSLPPIKIALAQINATVGDFSANLQQIRDYALQAKASGATLMLTPELVLTGYPPEDLLLRADFIEAAEQALLKLAQETHGITLVVGHPQRYQGALYNAASVLQDGQIIATYHKHFLPNYSVFDEERYFEAGSKALVFTHHGVQLGVLICEDIWRPEAAQQAKQMGAQLLLTLNASPFHLNKQQTRYDVASKRVQETGLPLVYVNLVGGQDELVFDGASFVMNAQGTITQELPFCRAALGMLELQAMAPVPCNLTQKMCVEAEVYEVLKLGLQDYIGKNGFKGIVLGLSGGIDSAITLAIAVDALGADKVHAVMMPTEFTAGISQQDAQDMAERVGVKYSVLPIQPLFEQFQTSLQGEFAGLPFDTAEENIQARIRGVLLMALSNKFGTILLTTGNKSEMAVGYSTLYGDMAGGFSVLKDVPKTWVYRLANYRNSIAPVIPERIITRAPSAELRANQTDQDSLPPYEILDAIMQAYVEEDRSPAQIVRDGYTQADVARVVRLIDRNEYKRRQAPIGVRITPRGFGRDRRYPITSKFNSINP